MTAVALAGADISVACVPTGAWAVGVSGGGDSVALLELLRGRGDLCLHVVHLDHETRAGESARDAEFVRELAARWGLPCTIARRTDVESTMTDLPANTSARYRAARLELFRRVVAAHALVGVILAHHADDQAETVLQRLLRGSSVGGLTGMSPRASVGGVTILRPLLGVRREALRAMLRERGIAWREDESNASPAQQRNRVRATLGRHPKLTEAAMDLAAACAGLVGWLRETAPELAEQFRIDVICRLPPPVAREALRRWLARRGVVGDEIDCPPAALERLLQMASDRATPPRQHFPGGPLVRRRGGMMFVEQP